MNTFARFVIILNIAVSKKKKKINKMKWSGSIEIKKSYHKKFIHNQIFTLKTQLLK